MLLVFGTAGSCLILKAKSCAEDGQKGELVSSSSVKVTFSVH